MLRWTETRDSYRVVRLPGVGVLALLLVSVATILGSGAWLYHAAIASAVMLGTIAILGCIVLVLTWRDAPWIEIPLHGGPVAWGRGTRQEGRTTAAVSHFDVVQCGRSGAYYELAAVHENGTPRTPMISWQGASPGGFGVLVRQLNEHIGAPKETYICLPGLVRRYRERAWEYFMTAIVVVCCVGTLLFALLMAIVTGWMRHVE